MEDNQLPQHTCPRCGTVGHFHRAEVEDNSGCAMLFFGGILPYLISQSAKSDMRVCPSCHYVFKAPTRMSKSEALLVSILCFIMTVIVIAILTSAWSHN